MFPIRFKLDRCGDHWLPRIGKAGHSEGLVGSENWIAATGCKRQQRQEEKDFSHALNRPASLVVFQTFTAATKSAVALGLNRA